MGITLQDRLNDLLRQAGVKQTKLAVMLDLAAPTVNQWLSGSGKCAEVHLVRIVEALFPQLAVEKRRTLLAELFLLRQQQRLRQDDADDRDRLGPSARDLAADAIDLLLKTLPTHDTPKTSGRTLMDFPGSFYPLTVVTGDKREDSESRINAADFGVVSASPAETRWISRLRLREDVQFLTDKVFVLESAESLQERFGRRNLLVVGSPGSNHLARRIHLWPPRKDWRGAAPFFRFNLPLGVLVQIEKFLDTLTDLNRKQLVGMQGDPNTEHQVKQWIRFLFSGGIFCPTGRYTVNGVDTGPNRDFGLITLARNPFAKSDEFVAILVAGLHMMGTAHALGMLGDPSKFERHPVGGVIRVDMRSEDRFAVRFDESTANWDTKELSEYTLAQLREDLEKNRKTPEPLASIASGESPTRFFAECLEFLDAL